MSKKGKRGVWYWVVLLNPVLYFVAKLIGDQPGADADLAMEDLGIGLVVVLVIIAVGACVWFVYTSLF